jgi:hypothetical protein
MRVNKNPTKMYLFDLKNGKKKLAYGQNAEDALKILRIRLTDEEMEDIIPDQYVRIRRQELIQYANKLG